jgi:hypothetical protein
MLPPSSELKNKSSEKFMFATYFILVYSTLKLKATCASETSTVFNGLHGVVSQKAELFMIIAVKT